MQPQSVQVAQASATLWINERVQELRRQGKRIYHFGFGQSPFPIPASVVEALREHAHRKEYLPVKGLPALREAAAAFLSRSRHARFSAEQILVGPGSKELLYLMQCHLEGVTYLPSPSWVSYEPQARYCGHPVRWIESENWKLTPENIRAQVREPGYLILNYPSNPTGGSFSAEELEALAEVFREKKLVVIADEIYGRLHFTGEVPSLASFYPEGTIVTTGLSKWCGAGGWRLGIAAFPDALRELMEQVAVMASETYTSATTPVQLAAVEAYQDTDEILEYLRRARRVLERVADYVHAQCVAYDLPCIKPMGGFYLFPDFANYRDRLGVANSRELCEVLLQEANLAFLPGSVFGRPPEELSLRLAFVDFDGEAALAQADEVHEPDWLRRWAPNVVEGMERLGQYLQG
ncbi:MAG: aminotransferase class I/II-fold pyridoxal phosphate-dependent enzyme [Lewinella sp.]|nr:aminotransferase class I/II-fold pyridoxal phosphate-dependent enzyme [Lewinella sp.]